MADEMDGTGQLMSNRSQIPSSSEEMISKSICNRSIYLRLVGDRGNIFLDTNTCTNPITGHRRTSFPHVASSSTALTAHLPSPTWLHSSAAHPQQANLLYRLCTAMTALHLTIRRIVQCTMFEGSNCSARAQCCSVWSFGHFWNCVRRCRRSWRWRRRLTAA